MTGAIAAAALLLAGQVQTTSPGRGEQGTPLEVCGKVTKFVVTDTRSCEASLTVVTPDGSSTVVVLAAAARQSPSGARELEGADACFRGTLQVPTAGSTFVRVPSLDSVRVTSGGTSASFGSGATDPCLAKDLVMPRLLHEVKPNYSSEAMRERVEGTVLLEAVVDPTGAVAHVRVVRGLHEDLDANAIHALRGWRFAPGRRDNQPVPVLVNVQMSFTLKTNR